MKFLPPYVVDVNADPQSLTERTALNAWLILNRNDPNNRLFDPRAYGEFLCNKYDIDRAKWHPTLYLFGGDGYIGSSISAVLSTMKIKVVTWNRLKEYDINPTDKFIHLACPRKNLMNGSIESPSAVYKSMHNWIDAARKALDYKPPFNYDNILYFSSQCVFNEPCTGPYSKMKQAGAQKYSGAEVIFPGTVFGKFKGACGRWDTVLNKLAYGISLGRDNFVTSACRSFITIHEIVEAVLRFYLGESIDLYQCYGRGRVSLGSIVGSGYKVRRLAHDTGNSLQNWFPYMEPNTVEMYREYFKLFIKYMEQFYANETEEG